METISPESRILFLGSGFSAGATNLVREELPLGRGLSDKFCSILDLPQGSLDLKNLADEINHINNPPLYDLLYETFTVGKITTAQELVLSLRWQRIYTTNYDDVVEYTLGKSGRPLQSYTWTDTKPSKVPAGAVIHLHGDIRHTTEDNVLDQLILNESSYVRQFFDRSPWYDQFVKDIRFCTACFFVGYSLNDHHISALLSGIQELSGRLYFVTKGAPNHVLERRVKEYSGRFLTVGTDGFATLCKDLPRPTRSLDPNNVRTFRYVNPVQERRLIKPTSDEVYNLFTLGTFNAARCFSTLPDADYVVPRAKEVSKATDLLKYSKTLLVHSRLGNGKTIFLSLLAYALSRLQYKCFVCRPNAGIIPEDLHTIFQFDRAVLIFDSYNTAMDFMPLPELPDSARIVIAVRTSILDARLHEINETLPGPVGRINLNPICPQDRTDIAGLLDKAGVLQRDMEVLKECRDLREIVVRLYDNEQIRRRVAEVIAPLLKDRYSRSVFSVIHMINWSGQEVDAAFVRSVTGRDAHVELAKHKEVSGDLFKLDDDSVQIRSPIFSGYVITKHLSAEDLLDAVHGILVEAVRRKSERRYQAILSSLMRASELERALARFPERLELLAALYDRLHRDVDVNAEPLFWLQYSILMTKRGNLDIAERFIDTAYDRAGASPGFQTYQIDTYCLRLFMLIEQSCHSGVAVQRFSEIIDKMDSVRNMLGNDSHRFHALEVLDGVEPFVRARIIDFSVRELNVLTLNISLVIDRLASLSREVWAYTDSDRILASLTRAREVIMRRPARANV